MQAEVENEAQLQAARALAMHLRQNPEDALRDPQILAERFGLSRAFVESVFNSVQVPNRREEPSAARPRLNLGFFVRGWTAAASFADRATQRPVLFVAISTWAAILLNLILKIVGDQFIPASSTSGGLKDWYDLGVTVGLTIFTFVLHMAVYFKHRMGRYALYGGLVCWVTLSSIAIVDMWLNREDILAQQESGSMPVQITLYGLMAVLVFSMFMLTAVYVGFGALASLVGGLVNIKRQALIEDRMTRQEMLERYFELQTKLASGGAAARDRLLDSDIVRAFQRNGPIWAFVGGVILSSVQLLLSYISINNNARPPTDFTFVVFLMAMIVVVQVLVVIAIGFFSRNTFWSVVNTLCHVAAGMAPTLTMFGVLQLFASPEVLESAFVTTTAENLKPTRFTIVGLAFVLVALLGTIGAYVQRRAYRDRSLAHNDPAAIVGEMVRLQWRLNDRVHSICVMVVDAAKSAEMKAMADPLAVEYSFREYQNWLAEIARALNGRVHSTAGDGAVIAFDSCLDAYLAAKRIQTDLARFNQEENRLSTPFRLRIGMHMGEIVGELDEVQFTEVIDIAAHVQSVAPIAGIAVTEAVASQIGTEEFVPLAHPVDGQNVLLAMNPTLDE